MDEINKKVKVFYCVVPENIHTPPTEGTGNSRHEGGGGRSQRPRGGGGGSDGGGGQRANPFHGGGGGVWIFSGTKHYKEYGEVCLQLL